jgi:hypothetical protein
MQYMLLIYDSEEKWQDMPEDERNAYYGEYFALTNELREKGAFIAGDQLQPTATAAVVRVENGERVVTDGPFAETKEQLGGYYLVEADSAEEAIAWAAKIPSARFGAIEVRPVVQVPTPA